MQTLDSVLARYWWTILMRGVLALAFGLVAFIWPGVTLAVLILLFGGYVLVDGIVSVVLGIKAYGDRERWWATLFGGLVSVAAGILTLLMPGITAFVLLLVIAAWAFIHGVLDVVAAIRLRHVIEGEWLLALAGVLSMGFGLLLIAFPGSGAVAVVWWVGGYALALGLMLILLGLRARTLTRALQA